MISRSISVGNLATFSSIWIAMAVVILEHLFAGRTVIAVITNDIYTRGLKGRPHVVYSGRVLQSFQVGSLRSCGILTRSLQKTLFRLTDGVLCEVLNDTLADPLKVTYSPTPLPSSSPILYSAVNTKFADSYHSVPIHNVSLTATNVTCNLTRPSDTPSPLFGMIVGVRANNTGRPRTIYDFKCRDVYEDHLMRVDFKSTFAFHTEYTSGGCPENYVAVGFQLFFTIGIPHYLTCHPVLPPATILSNTDCYHIDLLSSALMADPNLTLSVHQSWPAECGNGTGNYVLTSMRNTYQMNSHKPEMDRMTCCRLSVG